jgi:hypothetical protein
MAPFSCQLVPNSQFVLSRKKPGNAGFFVPLVLGGKGVTVGLLALGGLIAAAVDVDHDGRSVALLALLPELAALDGTFYTWQCHIFTSSELCP